MDAVRRPHRGHRPLAGAALRRLRHGLEPGISYGLFQQTSDLGRWGLVALSIAASIWLSLWLRRATGRLEAVSLALIIGGALGNVIDRIAYGAVADFVHLHWGEWSWYVFNVADAAIVVGVVGLLYDTLRRKEPAKA